MAHLRIDLKWIQYVSCPPNIHYAPVYGCKAALKNTNTHKFMNDNGKMVES